MSCERWRKRISDRLDGGLSSRRMAGLDRHLAVCPACRAYAGSLQAIQDAAIHARQAAFDPKRGEEFLLRLERRLDQEGQRKPETHRRPRRGRWVWVSAGGMAAAAGLAGYLLLRPVPRAEIYLLSETDVFSRIHQQYSQTPALEQAFDEILQSSIDESLKASEEGLDRNPFESPLLFEGVSEADLRILEEDLGARTPY